MLVKAAYGGGGRGMRIVTGPDEIVAAVASARREAASAFGNGTVFLERFVESPRHIEVQILGDQAGTVVHLFERECSIQRRYQKIIEEAPSPAVRDDLRAELCRAAVAAGQAIGYVGAGTVEFVLDASGRFYFLEVNTRLQVEHPVTELITGLDLVRLQLEIAAGQPLPPQVTGAGFTGHAIEARLYAEDVPAGYLPASGDVHTLEIDAADGLRVDAGFASGTRVSTFYDSMLAKVIGYGPTRDDARRVLAAALSRARLHGVVTNRDLLVGILREPEFAAGADRHRLPGPAPAGGAEPAAPGGRARAPARRGPGRAGPAARRGPGAGHACPRAGGTTPAPRSGPATSWTGGAAEVSYRFGRDGLQAEVDGAAVGGVVLHGVRPDPGAATAHGPSRRAGGPGRMRVDLEIGGVRRLIHVTQAGRTFYVDSALGHSVVTEADRFPDPAAAGPGRFPARPDARDRRPGRGRRGRPRRGGGRDPRHRGHEDGALDPRARPRHRHRTPDQRRRPGRQRVGARRPGGGSP